MKEFFINFIGYVTIVTMIISIVYTWSKLNYELKMIEKAE